MRRIVQLKLIVILSLSLSNLHVRAQNLSLEWAARIGVTSGNYVKATSMSIDAVGSVFTTGMYSGSVDFNPGTGNSLLTSSTGAGFLQKLDSTGAFVWVQEIAPIRSSHVAIGPTGNIYISGIFAFAGDFDPGPGVFNLGPYTPGTMTGFVMKLDPNGQFLWAKRLGLIGTNFSPYFEDVVVKCAVDNNDNVFVVGGSIGGDWDPGPGSLSSQGMGQDIVLIKFSPSGNVLWGGLFGSTNDDYALGLAVDNQGDVILTGSFAGPMDIDITTGVYQVSGTDGAFVIKYSASGVLQWGFGLSQCLGMTVISDGVNNVIVGGSFYGSVDFNPGFQTFNLTAVGGYTDGYVAKFNSGGGFVSAIALGGAGDDFVECVTEDILGNIVCSGGYADDIDCDPSSGATILQHAGSKDVFVGKYTSQLTMLWAVAINSVDDERLYSLAVDASNSLLLAGAFRGDIDVNPSANYTMWNGAGNQHGFVLSWVDNITPGISEVPHLKLAIFPTIVENGVLNISGSGCSTQINYIVINMSGRIVQFGELDVFESSATLDISRLTSGSYMISLYDWNTSLSSFKFIVHDSN